MQRTADTIARKVADQSIPAPKREPADCPTDVRQRIARADLQKAKTQCAPSVAA